MTEDLITALIVIVPVALISAGLVVLRADALSGQTANPGPAHAEEAGAAARRFALGVLVSSLIGGLLISTFYRGVVEPWSDNAPALFAALGTGLAVVLSIAAAIVRPLLTMGGVLESVALNLLWGVAYGWVLPLLIG
jgi:hypothetical protein